MYSLGMRFAQTSGKGKVWTRIIESRGESAIMTHFEANNSNSQPLYPIREADGAVRYSYSALEYLAYLERCRHWPHRNEREETTP
jgi:hypothetical protein